MLKSRKFDFISVKERERERFVHAVGTCLSGAGQPEEHFIALTWVEWVRLIFFSALSSLGAWWDRVRIIINLDFIETMDGLESYVDFVLLNYIRRSNFK